MVNVPCSTEREPQGRIVLLVEEHVEVLKAVVFIGLVRGCIR
jgi:hypothetical protein